MHTLDASHWKHGHHFCDEFARAEKNTRPVLILTVVFMMPETRSL